VLSHPLVSAIPKSIAFFEDSLASPARPSDKSSIKMTMIMEHWWNGTDWVKPN
jgi:hypothetical protein